MSLLLTGYACARSQRAMGSPSMCRVTAMPSPTSPATALRREISCFCRIQPGRDLHQCRPHALAGELQRRRVARGHHFQQRCSDRSRRLCAPPRLGHTRVIGSRCFCGGSTDASRTRTPRCRGKAVTGSARAKFDSGATATRHKTAPTPGWSFVVADLCLTGRLVHRRRDDHGREAIAKRAASDPPPGRMHCPVHRSLACGGNGDRVGGRPATSTYRASS